MKKSILFICIIFAFAKANSQDIKGTWKTIDDETSKAKSIVDIYEKNGKIYGKIVKVLVADAPKNPLCTKCSGDLKDTPMIGLEIIKDLEKDGNVYKDGTILDPENGKSYTCKIWINEENDNQLMVRGFVTFFYRTQTWQRL
jgi:uncharacterized protein (DUF2147 family)